MRLELRSSAERTKCPHCNSHELLKNSGTREGVYEDITDLVNGKVSEELDARLVEELHNFYREKVKALEEETLGRLGRLESDFAQHVSDFKTEYRQRKSETDKAVAAHLKEHLKRVTSKEVPKVRWIKRRWQEQLKREIDAAIDAVYARSHLI